MRNTDQKVDVKKFGESYDRIFANSEKKVESGSFMYDASSGQTIKVERKRVMRNDVDPLVESIRRIDPIQMSKKEVMNAH